MGNFYLYGDDLHKMKIKYKNKKVKKQCEDLKTAVKDFDNKTAEKLHATINFIKNAKNLRDIVNMPIYHFHHLEGKRKEQYAMDINGRKSGYRLIVVPLDENENEVRRDGAESIFECTNILLIVEVSKHYD